jgi:hypothetical protein
MKKFSFFRNKNNLSNYFQAPTGEINIAWGNAPGNSSPNGARLRGKSNLGGFGKMSIVRAINTNFGLKHKIGTNVTTYAIRQRTIT